MPTGTVRYNYITFIVRMDGEHWPPIVEGVDMTRNLADGPGVYRMKCTPSVALTLEGYLADYDAVVDFTKVLT